MDFAPAKGEVCCCMKWATAHVAPPARRAFHRLPLMKPSFKQDLVLLLRRRVTVIALGNEDIKDHDKLRSNALPTTLSGCADHRLCHDTTRT